MKQTFILIIIALFAATQIGCSKEEVLKYDGGMYSQNFIGAYITDCDSLALKSIDERIYIVFEGLWVNEYNHSNIFDSIAKANNDTSFNAKRIGFHDSINDSIFSISIKCDKDLDKEHPAGTELNDIFTFNGKSYYTVIQKHYYKYDAEFMTMLAKDVTPAKTHAMYIECSLSLNTPPTQSGTYTFEVAVKLSEKTLKNTVTMEF